MIIKTAFKKVFFASFLFLLIGCNLQKENTKKARLKVVTRQIANELLLSNNDSTSLILPVKYLNENTFLITFQEKLSFEPNILVERIKSNFEKEHINNSYRVEVLQCKDNEVAYSYEIHQNIEKTIIPCVNRELPFGCYSIKITFLDSIENNFFGDYKLLVFIGFLLLFVFYVYQRKSKRILQVDETKTSKTIGSFTFYPDQNKLIKKAKEINLSKKECELLQIFVSKPNQIIKREELTKKVWEDNGVFVGRSLDTYISKLRKKLQEDDSIKLTNIHGVGYKLEFLS